MAILACMGFASREIFLTQTSTQHFEFKVLCLEISFSGQSLHQETLVNTHDISEKDIWEL